MRILLLSQYCYPEPGPRVHELALGLSNKGHQVTIITGFPTYPYTHFYKGYRLHFWLRDSYKGVRILRLPHFPHGGKSSIKRILHYVSFMLSTVVIGNLLIRKADCMYVFLPPPLMGISAWIIGLFRRIPFMYDVQDIWPDAVAVSGMIKSKLAIQLLGLVEKFIYRKVAVISVPAPGYKKNLIGKGVSPDKIKIISNWSDESVYRALPYNNSLAEKFGMKGKFNILFAGNLGKVQALDTVILTAKLLVDIRDIQFVFAGDGMEEERLKLLSKEMGLNNVFFLGRFPPKEISEICSIADVLLVHLKKDPLSKLTIPSKTFSYMAIGKPILMAVEGDAAALIRSIGAGVTCSPENPPEMANAINTIRHMSDKEREIMGKAGKNAFLQEFRRDIIVDKFEKVLQDISYQECIEEAR